MKTRIGCFCVFVVCVGMSFFYAYAAPSVAVFSSKISKNSSGGLSLKLECVASNAQVTIGDFDVGGQVRVQGCDTEKVLQPTISYAFNSVLVNGYTPLPTYAVVSKTIPFSGDALFFRSKTLSNTIGNKITIGSCASNAAVLNAAGNEIRIILEDTQPPRLVSDPFVKKTCNSKNGYTGNDILNGIQYDDACRPAESIGLHLFEKKGTNCNNAEHRGNEIGIGNAVTAPVGVSKFCVGGTDPFNNSSYNDYTVLVEDKNTPSWKNGDSFPLSMVFEKKDDVVRFPSFQAQDSCAQDRDLVYSWIVDNAVEYYSPRVTGLALGNHTLQFKVIDLYGNNAQSPSLNMVVLGSSSVAYQIHSSPYVSGYVSSLGSNFISFTANAIETSFGSVSSNAQWSVIGSGITRSFNGVSYVNAVRVNEIGCPLYVSVKDNDRYGIYSMCFDVDNQKPSISFNDVLNSLKEPYRLVVDAAVLNGIRTNYGNAIANLAANAPIVFSSESVSFGFRVSDVKAGIKSVSVSVKQEISNAVVYEISKELSCEEVDGGLSLPECRKEFVYEPVLDSFERENASEGLYSVSYSVVDYANNVSDPLRQYFVLQKNNVDENIVSSLASRVSNVLENVCQNNIESSREIVDLIRRSRFYYERKFEGQFLFFMKQASEKLSNIECRGASVDVLIELASLVYDTAYGFVEKIQKRYRSEFETRCPGNGFSEACVWFLMRDSTVECENSSRPSDDCFLIGGRKDAHASRDFLLRSNKAEWDKKYGIDAKKILILSDTYLKESKKIISKKDVRDVRNAFDSMIKGYDALYLFHDLDFDRDLVQRFFRASSVSHLGYLLSVYLAKYASEFKDASADEVGTRFNSTTIEYINKFSQEMNNFVAALEARRNPVPSFPGVVGKWSHSESYRLLYLPIVKQLDILNNSINQNVYTGVFKQGLSLVLMSLMNHSLYADSESLVCIGTGSERAGVSAESPWFGCSNTRGTKYPSLHGLYFDGALNKTSESIHWNLQYAECRYHRMVQSIVDARFEDASDPADLFIESQCLMLDLYNTYYGSGQFDSGDARIRDDNCTALIEKTKSHVVEECRVDFKSVPDLCNGFDDDADGSIDEDFVSESCGCRGLLSNFTCPCRSESSCVNGIFFGCQPDLNQKASSDLLCDNVDDDCDGQLNENFQGVSCGVGVCRRASQCDSSGGVIAEIPCEPGQPSLMESCDNEDNNCNGSTDEGLDDDGDGYAKIGVSGGSCFLGDCNDSDASVFPTALEMCDGKDNDCDSQVDEGVQNACGTCGDCNGYVYEEFDVSGTLLSQTGNGACVGPRLQSSICTSKVTAGECNNTLGCAFSSSRCEVVACSLYASEAECLAQRACWWQSPNGVGLSVDASQIPFAWIANAGTDDRYNYDEIYGTVSKFNTKTGVEVGRYCSALQRAPLNSNAVRPFDPAICSPCDSCNSPSRTAVDVIRNGDAYVANRAFSNFHGTVTKFLNVDPSNPNNLTERCIEHNRIEGIQTSRDVNGDGVIDADMQGDRMASISPFSFELNTVGEQIVAGEPWQDWLEIDHFLRQNATTVLRSNDSVSNRGFSLNVGQIEYWGELDECIAWTFNPAFSLPNQNSSFLRSLAVNLDGDVLTGAHSRHRDFQQRFFRVRQIGNTLSSLVIRNTEPSNHYGAVLGQNGLVFSLSRNNFSGGDEVYATNLTNSPVTLERVSSPSLILAADTQATLSFIPIRGLGYGIAVDPSGNIWSASYGGDECCGALGISNPLSSPLMPTRCLLNPGAVFNALSNRCTQAVGTVYTKDARGITVDAQNRAWVAYNNYRGSGGFSALVSYDLSRPLGNNISPSNIISLNGSSTAVGVGIGYGGNVWVADQNADILTVYNPSSGVQQNINIAGSKVAKPYTYSDFTGSQMNLSMPNRGSFTKQIDALVCGAGKKPRWERMVWQGFIPVINTTSNPSLTATVDFFEGASLIGSSVTVVLSGESSSSGACAGFAGSSTAVGTPAIGHQRTSCVDLRGLSPSVGIAQRIRIQFNFSSNSGFSYSYSPQLQTLSVGSVCVDS